MSKKRNRKKPNPATRDYFDKCNHYANVWHNSAFVSRMSRIFGPTMDKMGKGGLR